VELLLVDRVASARVCLCEHAHEMAGVVSAQIAGTVLPAADGLGVLGVETSVGAEDRENSIWTSVDVGVAAEIVGVGEDAVGLSREETVGELDRRQRERLHGGFRAGDR